LLIVNVACKCGLTALNYQQLPQLYDEYASKGLKILAFPCNQFGSQEPGSHAEILEFVKKYDADMAEKLVFFEKADVNGVDARAPFVALKDACPSDDGTKDIGWNFQKFLVDHEGMPFKNYSPRTAPVDMKADIDALLSKRG
jgi:glutathione peroxidase-family protein